MNQRDVCFRGRMEAHVRLQHHRWSCVSVYDGASRFNQRYSIRDSSI